MKKLVIILAFLILSTSLAYMMIKLEDKHRSHTDKKNQSAKVIEYKRQEHVNVGEISNVKEHTRENIDCKSCHNCEYPTHEEPCLIQCPRTDVSVYHSPDEAPDVIVLSNLTNRFGQVVFSHKTHAEMSVMSNGCSGCHHYNTTGPVLKCGKCHESERIRKDLTKPDLEAAFHRQCMTCHRQWQRTTDCQSCHLPKGREGVAKREEALTKARSFVHPPIPEPVKIVYQTAAKKGKIVTFFHDEHTKLFNIPCVTCHHDENCIRCHDINLVAQNKDGSIYKKVHKSFDQHHQPCSNCHDIKNCNKCHFDGEIPSFNHYNSSGWELGKFHTKLKCSACHDDSFKKKMSTNCTGCHLDFKPGKFVHDRTGLKLSESHVEIECESCHNSPDFRSKMECKICHDDKDYPKQLPGKKIK